MPTWKQLFNQYGKVFTKPDKDMPQAVRFFKHHKVKKILDLGCGTGRHLVYLAQQGCEVYGLDNSGTALAMAKAWLAKKQITAHLKQGDLYQQLPYQDNFFDAVISNGAINHGTTAHQVPMSGSDPEKF